LDYENEEYQNKRQAAQGHHERRAAKKPKLGKNDQGRLGSSGPGVDAPASGDRRTEQLTKGSAGDWQKEGYSLVHLPGEEEAYTQDKDGNKVGWLLYSKKNGYLQSHNINIIESHRRKGLADALYSLAEKETGLKFKPSDIQTDEGKALWDSPNRSFGKPSLAKMLKSINTARPRLQIASIAVLDGNKLLIGKRNDDGRYNMPGGKIDKNESHLDGAVRELMEETGINPGIHKFEYLGSTDGKSHVGREITVHSYVVKGNYGTNSKNDPDGEVDKWVYVDISNGLPKEYADNWHNKEDYTLKK
jgi:8-oxo-dGTP pyrophosphatase MutT (NUDIX family)